MNDNDNQRSQHIDIQTDEEPQNMREAIPVEDEVLYDKDTEEAETFQQDAEAPIDDARDEVVTDEEVVPEGDGRSFMDEMFEGDGDFDDDEYVDMPSYDDLVAENAKLNRQLVSVINQYEALKRDWESYRKRSQAELERSKALASERVTTQIIPVIDDLWRSIDHIRNMGDELQPLANGNEAIANRIVMALSKEGVEVISPLGEPFDVNRHQAIAMQEIEGKKPGLVFHVYQDGYAIGDRVIRPASVGVTK